MARDHARISTEIGADEDWTALSHAEHDTYYSVLAEPSLNYCGITPLMVNRWSEQARDASPRTTRRHLEVLAERRFLVIDWRKEEVLVRALLRRDKILKQPNVAKSAYASWLRARSPMVRTVALYELHRIHEGSPALWTEKSFEIDYAGPWLKEPLPEGLPEGFLEGLPEPWPKGFADSCGKG